MQLLRGQQLCNPDGACCAAEPTAPFVAQPNQHQFLFPTLGKSRRSSKFGDPAAASDYLDDIDCFLQLAAVTS